MARGSDGVKAFMDGHPLAEHSDSEEFWAQYLEAHPDVLHRLLHDVYQATYGADRPPSLDDLWDLVASPSFTSQPFPEAVRTLLAGRSVRWLATQSKIPQPVLQRLLTGVRPVIIISDPVHSMIRLEAIARALHVHPSYFAEWRRLWIMTLLNSAFTAQPSLSVGVFRRYSGFEKSLPNGRSA